MTQSYAYGKQWRLDHARGIPRIVDANAAKRRIDTLVGQGWSLRAIAGAAGVAPTTTSRIHSGAPRTSRRVATAILAIPLDEIPTRPSTQTTEPFVPRVGSVRRIQALIFMGWPHHAMHARTGLRTQYLLSQQGRWVTRTTHDKIAALYDDLAMTPGPSNQTRGWAAKLGYVGPLAWDDIDRDEAPNLDGREEAS